LQRSGLPLDAVWVLLEPDAALGRVLLPVDQL
jgi:hypothetical protein